MKLEVYERGTWDLQFDLEEVDEVARVLGVHAEDIKHVILRGVSDNMFGERISTHDHSVWTINGPPRLRSYLIQERFDALSQAKPENLRLHGNVLRRRLTTYGKWLDDRS